MHLRGLFLIAQYMLRNTQSKVDKQLVQSLDRGLIILEAVAKSPSPVKLAEMAALLGIDRSSAFRLAGTLKRRGFLFCPVGRKDYILGPAIWRLAREYDWSSTLVKISHEELKLLAGATGETAHVAVREGREALFIDHVTSSHVIAVSGQTGEHVPLHCTAHGKALLADFDKPALEALLGTKPLEAYSKQTIVSVDQLARACSQIRAQGIAADDREFGDGIRCVAAPIRDQDGSVIGSIGVSAPLTRFPKERYSLCSKQVLETAAKINQILSNGLEKDPAVAGGSSGKSAGKRDAQHGA